MADYWARILVAPDNRAFILEVSPDVVKEYGTSIISELKPKGWNKTVEGIYLLKLTANLNIKTMDRVGLYPYPNAPAPEPADDVSNTQPGQLAADDFTSISKAMRNLGIR